MYLAAVDGGLSGLTLADWLGVTATIVAVLGIILSVYLYKRSKSSKFLRWALLDAQTLKTNAAFPGLAINLVYENGEILEQAYIYLLHVENGGTQKIRKIDDFERPLLVKGGCESSIVNVTVDAVSHDGIHGLGVLDRNFTADGGADITPNLLNPGDWMRFRVLATDNQPPTLTAWIVDQSQDIAEVDEGIVGVSRSQRRRRLFFSYVPLLLGLIVGGGSLGFISYLQAGGETRKMPGAMVGVATESLITAGIVALFLLVVLTLLYRNMAKSLRRRLKERLPRDGS